VADDLGAKDSWSTLGDDDRSIANDQGTGACDQATARIRAIMDCVTSASGRFALEIDRGVCHCDFQAQAMCDGACDTQQACTPGTVETRCEPGQLSVSCSGNCAAQSTCEGSAEHSCNCVGQCESTCMGSCEGECIHDDGTSSINDENCMGHCTPTCRGSCDGSCQVADQNGVSCGSDVHCKGTCMGSFSDPICESEFNPPNCTANIECHESCRAKIAAHPICEPTRVKLIADVTVKGDADVQKLVDTINRNMPLVLDSAEIKGRIAVDAAAKLSDTGQQVLNTSGSLDGHSLACAKVAAEAALGAAGTIKSVSVGSINVATTTKQRASWGAAM
jgi:hypothetical protein